jgi:hypothetical protein
MTTPDELADQISALLDAVEADANEEDRSQQEILETLIGDIRRTLAGEPEDRRAKVILFKPSGKYYTEEAWRIPAQVEDYSPKRGNYVRRPILPSDMLQSPDFRRIDFGAVLVVSQEPWGYPHLFPSEG